VLVTFEQFRHATFDVAISRVRADETHRRVRGRDQSECQLDGDSAFRGIQPCIRDPHAHAERCGIRRHVESKLGRSSVVTLLCRPRSALRRIPAHRDVPDVTSGREIDDVAERSGRERSGR
jgi:hypothetical protein